MVGDEVTELASANVTSQAGAWYDVSVHWDGAELSVSRGRCGGALTGALSAETTLSNTSANVGFGVGEKADYNFDDVRFFDPTALESGTPRFQATFLEEPSYRMDRK